MPTALLIIDVQAALCDGEHAVHDARGVIGRINALAHRVRAAGRPVVVIQHEAPGSPFEHGSAGWSLAAGLDTEPGDLRVRKRASDAFHDTDLQALLRAHGTTSLIVCGMQSDFCVDSTTRRALALGYPVQLASDAHTTVDNAVLRAPQISAHHDETLSNLASYGPRATAVPSARVDVHL